MRKFLPLVLVLLVTAPLAADFSSPEAAIHTLETAYIAKDIDAAVAAKDFGEEARLMLAGMSPQMASDAEVLGKTAEVLELSFRKEISDRGFPDFRNAKCSLGNPQSLSPTLVRITESCVYSDGTKSTQDLHAFKGQRGWRVVTVSDEQP